MSGTCARRADCRATDIRAKVGKNAALRSAGIESQRASGSGQMTPGIIACISPLLAHGVLLAVYDPSQGLLEFPASELTEPALKTTRTTAHSAGSTFFKRLVTG